MENKNTLTSFQNKMKEMMKKSSQYANNMKKYAQLEKLLFPDKVVEKDEKNDKTND